MIKELSHVFVNNNHVINLKGMGSCEEEVFNRSPELLWVKPTERELLLKVTNFGLPNSLNNSQSA
jgi:hypothetical protein